MNSTAHLPTVRAAHGHFPCITSYAKFICETLTWVVSAKSQFVVILFLFLFVSSPRPLVAVSCSSLASFRRLWGWSPSPLPPAGKTVVWSDTGITSHSFMRNGIAVTTKAVIKRLTTAIRTCLSSAGHYHRSTMRISKKRQNNSLSHHQGKQGLHHVANVPWI